MTDRSGLPPGDDGDGVHGTLETSGEQHLPAERSVPEDEGGDPACWAHLFEDGPATGTDD